MPTPTIGEIISYFKRPKLVVFIPKDEPKKQDIGKRRRAFYHVGVKNVGKVTIKNARMYLNFEGNGIKVGVLAKWDFKAEPFDSYDTLHRVPQFIVNSQVHDVLPAIVSTWSIVLGFRMLKNAVKHSLNAEASKHFEP